MRPDVVTVAVTRADGGLTVLRIVTTEYSPSGEVRWTEAPTPGYINSVIAKHEWGGPLAPVSWRIVPNDFVDDATDRSYRNAWKDGGQARPIHDMPKARTIHRIKLRKQRGPLLHELDNQYLRAHERGETLEMQRIAQEKERLRNITADPRIEAAQTIEELKQVTI